MPSIKMVLPAVALSALCILAIAVLTHVRGRTIDSDISTLASCFEKGRTAEDPVNVPCLNRTVDKLIAKYGTTAVMQHINTPATQPAVGYNCHLIGHLIGHKTYARAASLEDAFAQCTIDCRHSCIHGATNAAVQQELSDIDTGDDVAHSDLGTLKRIGAQYCARSGLFCHAIGHFVRNSVLTYPEALEICDGMGKNRAQCYAGVFMEDASGIESNLTGNAVYPVLTNDYTAPCASVESRYSTQCFRYLPMYQNNLYNQNGIVSSESQRAISRAACESLQRDRRAQCFFGLGGYTNRLHDDNGAPIDRRAFCESLSTEADREACTVGVVRTYLILVPPAYKQTFSYCERVPDQMRSLRCFHAAFKIMEATAPSLDREALCNTVGSAACNSAFKSYASVSDHLPQYFWGLEDE